MPFGACAAALLLMYAPLLDEAVRQNEAAPPESAPMPKDAMPGPFSRLGITLKRGDTLLDLLTRHGVQPPSAHDLIAKLRPLLNLRKLRSGNQVDLVVDPANRAVQAMEVSLDDNIVRAKATAQGWTVEREAIPSTPVRRLIRENISSSLYVNGVAAGLLPEHILELATIFEYDIDFFSDFQRGDEFSVVVDELHYATGRRAPRKIRAAALEADGKIHSAFYFAPESERGSYYDSEGNQLRRSFLRAPLSYTRITSPYTVARRHPIFRILRPHRAIDYAAPRGTPVVAIGSGKVSVGGWRGGYGKFVEIIHPNGYASRYGHFSRIARGIRRGVQVNAGDVIGYVGQTGHATGPHLHFEFLKGGKKLNFLKLNIPRIQRLAGNDLKRFNIERDENMAWFRRQGPTMTQTAGAL